MTVRTISWNMNTPDTITVKINRFTSDDDIKDLMDAITWAVRNPKTVNMIRKAKSVKISQGFDIPDTAGRATLKDLTVESLGQALYEAVKDYGHKKGGTRNGFTTVNGTPLNMGDI